MSDQPIPDEESVEALAATDSVETPQEEVAPELPAELEEQALSAEELQEFENNVATYLTFSKKAKADFLENMLNLGCLLSSFQDTWKPRKMWMSFLEQIKINYSTSNILIRLYEYSLVNPTVVRSCDLDGWNKIQNFIKLSDHLKEELSSEIQGGDYTVKEFIALVESLGTSEETAALPSADTPENGVEPETPNAESSFVPEHIVDRLTFEKDAVAKSIEADALLDAGFLAERLVTNLRTAGFDAPEECLPVAESYVLVSKALSRIKTVKWGNLNEATKEEWKNMVKESIQQLSDLLQQ